MNLNDQKEQFSNAFIQALAARAGYGLAKPIPDEDSVDWFLHVRGPYGKFRSPSFGVQLKASSLAFRNDTIAYPLKLKNYDDLRAQGFLVPRVLILVHLPEKGMTGSAKPSTIYAFGIVPIGFL